MKLKNIQFGNEAFRKLRNLKIDFAPRITVISGHNGIGKSTILGLVANCSGLSGGSEKSLFSKLFQSNFQEVFYLDYQNDLEKYSKKTPKFIISYEMPDGEIFYKSCSVSSQRHQIDASKFKNHMVKAPPANKAEKAAAGGEDSLTEDELDDVLDLIGPAPEKEKVDIWRLRIIPRNYEGSPIPGTMKELEEKYKIGGSMKVPIPTLYLGMSRMSPIGEFESELILKSRKNISEEDAKYIIDCFNFVLPYSKQEMNPSGTVTFHAFSQSKKQSIAPNFDHNSLAISLGQDSTSSIVTALASFNKLQRSENYEYKGGILVIDEIEAGLHPRAQINLMNLLKREAKRLSLQIIVTSHSLTVIKNIFDGNASVGEKYQQDSVLYLSDTALPRLMNDVSYTKIKNDMVLLPLSDDPVSKEPELNVYFEDNEALFFFESILRYKEITDTYSRFGYKLNLVSASLGVHNIYALNKASEHFRQSLIVLDGDMSDTHDSHSKKGKVVKADNICALPGRLKLTSGEYLEDLPPDRIFFRYLKDKLDNAQANADFWIGMPDQFTTDNVRENVIYSRDYETIPENERKREFYKKWFKQNQGAIVKSNLIKAWCKEHADDVDAFVDKLTKRVDTLKNNSGQNA
ncbi:AAA family ATPase [Brucella pseudogrignonensis]|uniref:AAA family ATPase n=1 Tax=Brucella pseudogrignonensis TaxID=419475 RepID=UPI0038B6AC5B